jgi:isocitrate dehydrogenase
MDATLRILDAAGAKLELHEIDIGEKVYLSGHTSGIKPEAWDTLRRTKVFLKAPITTPVGKGYKSLNVSIRKTLGLYANVRPCVSYAPYVESRSDDLDLVIIRENEEDLYAGIEHRQTDEVVQCLKLLSRPGCERIVRYAFEYCRAHKRKTLTCFVKDNIMKLSDGLFYRVFEEIGAAEYPDIRRERMIVDIGAAMLADQPQMFDALVMPNLYGDIMSDIAAQVSGSVGLGGSANIGEHCAMFEAIHGSAPDLAGKDVANPSGLLLGAVQMLMHIKHPGTAGKIYNAWLKTIEDGVHTGDIYKGADAPLPSTELAGTTRFADAVIERLGETPKVLKPANYESSVDSDITHASADWEAASKAMFPEQQKDLHGVDVFVQFSPKTGADTLADGLKKAAAAVPSLDLRLITNRGVKVWPEGFPETFCVDHWRCRFRAAHQTKEGGHGTVERMDIVNVQKALVDAGFDVVKTENLYLFDGELGFSLGQGE